ncbi:hypothetical protein, partial [Escherichia coli]|uniref:hypothetical protein n=1 Tax=Escherichia coli TaxID=562 RepID=UPI0019D5994E
RHPMHRPHRRLNRRNPRRRRAGNYLHRRLSHSERARIGKFDRLQISSKWPMTLFNNYFRPPADNKKRFIDIGF